MKARDLSLDELLERSSLGPLRMLGQRVLLMDAVALGLLRKELISTLGITAARGVFSRFGFAHGYRAAQALEGALPWDEPREWRIAGAQIHRIQGLVIPQVPQEDSDAFAIADWFESYEAEQHKLCVGPATEPVCWTLCGFVSGYLTAAHQRPVYAVEERCMACGDPHCRMIARFAEDWGSARETIAAPYERCTLENTLSTVMVALERADRALHDRRRALEQAQQTPFTADGSVIVASAAMRRVLELVERVSKTDTTVLVTGESGVGKERVARLLHTQSNRAASPFLAINCGAITETLLESELFGHKRGAFTGANADRAGLFEAAGGGTLLLDEVGELSPSLQVKLLRVLQEREVRRVGENKARAVDVRVIAATHRDLRQMVSQGTFREDLFYRLRVIEVAVPPLRARREDVLAIARAVLSRASTRLGRSIAGFTPCAADALSRYEWPGNVRELENAIERAVVLTDGPRVDIQDLPEEVREPKRATASTGAAQPFVGQTLAQAERALILATLAANQGHQGKTAAQLGIGTATLYRKLREYGPDGAAYTRPRETDR